MNRRRIALGVAAVIGLGFVAVIGARSLRHRTPSHDMHTRYRVALEVPPVEAALWFADRYPEYFTSGEDGLGPWLASLAPADRDFVLAMAQTLTWAWVEHELELLDARELEDLGVAASEVVRHKTLNQLELNAEQFRDTQALELDAWFGSETFGAGVFARAVRGVSNCEGQNHLLALLLATELERRGSTIEVTMAGLAAGHELVRLDGGELEQPVFVDAWSNLSPFTIDPSRPGAAPMLVEQPGAVDPDLVGFAAHPIADYAESQRTRITLVPARDAPSNPVSFGVRAPSLELDALARERDPWRVYLFARILHLYDDPRAGDVYRLVASRHCAESQPRTYVCEATAVLLARLRSGGESPG